ncbi:MAG: hypothetical protein WBX16_13785 [Candidatus Acidiferrales bacterium]
MKHMLMTGILVLGVFGVSAWATRAQMSGGTQDTSTAAPNSQAGLDQDIDMLRKDIRSKKKQLIAANLTLTDADATRFWPVYDQYTADLVKINNEKYALIKEYANSWGTISNEQSLDLIKRALAVDEQVAQLRIRYVPIFLGVLTGQKTATFFQLDRRLQAMIDLQLMSQLPLVQAQK